MLLYIDRDTLLAGLTRVQGIVEKRNTPNPVLSCVLLEANNGMLRMTATDSELSYIGDFPATVESPGSVAVDAQALFQIARLLPDPTTRLSLGAQHRLEISSGSAWYRVVGLSAAEFPALPDFDGRGAMTLRARHLGWLIDRTSFVVCPDDNRFGINGAHLEVVDDNAGRPQLRMVATDGHRLSYAQVPFEGDFSMGQRMLIPRKALGEMRKLSERLDEQPVRLSFGENSALLEVPGARFHFRLVEGEFPDYRRVVPTSHQRHVSVNRGVLSDALRRVAVLAQDRSRPVRFEFDAQLLTVRAQNAELGDAQEQVPIELDGDPLKIGFNIRYFQEVINALGADRIRLELGDALAPAVVREPESDEGLLIVMPMRLD